MTDDVRSAIDEARDTAQVMVTAMLHGDRSQAVEAAQGYKDPLVLALVLGDLVAHVHHRWSVTTGLSREGRDTAWAMLLADAEEWKLSDRRSS